MATLGEELKAAREKRGLTLEQIAETTRISHTFLKALEEDDYAVIPGEVFVTGFLRSYARELGVDENQILARYREAHPLHKEETQPEPAPETARHKIKPALTKLGSGFAMKKRSPLYMIILGGLLLGAVLTGITVLLTPKEEKAVAPAPAARRVEAPRPEEPQQFRQSSTAFMAVTAATRPETPCPPAGKTAMPVRTSHKQKAKTAPRRAAAGAMPLRTSHRMR